MFVATITSLAFSTARRVYRKMLGEVAITMCWVMAATSRDSLIFTATVRVSLSYTKVFVAQGFHFHIQGVCCAKVLLFAAKRQLQQGCYYFMLGDSYNQVAKGVFGYFYYLTVGR